MLQIDHAGWLVLCLETEFFGEGFRLLCFHPLINKKHCFSTCSGGIAVQYLTTYRYIDKLSAQHDLILLLLLPSAARPGECRF